MTSCCARCRRGTKATGLGPCGYAGLCKCHSFEQNDPVERLIAALSPERTYHDSKPSERPHSA